MIGRRARRAPARRTGTKQRLVVVGSLPPPFHGANVSTGLLVSSPVLQERFELDHLDISDRRDDRGNLGRWDIQNVLGGLTNAARLFPLLRGRRGVIYIAIAQNLGGMMRDSLYIHMSALMGWKVAVHLRGADLGDNYRAHPAPIRWWMRRMFARMNSMAVMGENLRPVFDGLIPPQRLAVVYNGTPEVTLPELPTDPEQVLFFSNLRNRKGIVEAVDAALLVLPQWPTARFVFVGEWESDELERDVREQARPGGDQIAFHPPVRNEARLEYFATSGMLMCPSTGEEGHPRVVLEALAAGLPVIATDRGGVIETIVEGESGFVLADPVPSELADRILLLLRDRELRNRMSKAARKRYEECYTLNVTDNKFGDWIDSVARN